LKGKFIVFEGNIGAGKTTIAKRIADDYKAHLVLETYEENPFLPKFYNDNDRYAFPLELSFLAERYNQLKYGIGQQTLFGEITVADYYFMKSYIFARNTLNDDEFKLYRQFFELTRSSIVKPDLLIYLHRNVDVLQQNITQRGRVFEQAISDEYLLKIQQGYFTYFKEVVDFPVVVIDCDGVDFNKTEDYSNLKRILEGEYQNGVSYSRLY